MRLAGSLTYYGVIAEKDWNLLCIFNSWKEGRTHGKEKEIITNEYVNTSLYGEHCSPEVVSAVGWSACEGLFEIQ